jgi:hypothetical protein
MHKLAVKPEGAERRTLNAALVHIAAGCYLLVKGIALLQLQEYQLVWYHLPVFVIALASVGYGLLKKFIDPAARFHMPLRLLQLALFTTLGVYYGANGSAFDAVFLFLWAGGWIFLILAERKIVRPVVVCFTEEGVQIPGVLANQQLSWSTLADVVVRPDYITLFRNDNRFLQFEVAQEKAKEELEELASFCNKKLQRPAHATVKE